MKRRIQVAAIAFASAMAASASMASVVPTNCTCGGPKPPTTGGTGTSGSTAPILDRTGGHSAARSELQLAGILGGTQTCPRCTAPPTGTPGQSTGAVLDRAG